jgi:proline iminopeptidase
MRMKLAAPHAELKIFRNASHMPFYENPADYYPALIDFLARNGSK